MAYQIIPDNLNDDVYWDMLNERRNRIKTLTKCRNKIIRRFRAIERMNKREEEEDKKFGRRVFFSDLTRTFKWANLHLQVVMVDIMQAEERTRIKREQVQLEEKLGFEE